MVKSKTNPMVIIGIASAICFVIFFGMDLSYTRNNLVMENDFENGTILPFAFEKCCTHSLNIVKLGINNNALQVLQKCEDPLVSSGKRAEIKTANVTMHSEMWYGFAMTIPKDWNAGYNSSWLILAQWHEIPDWNLGENWRSPPVSLDFNRGIVTVTVRNDSRPVGGGIGSKIYNITEISNVVGKRTRWVFHMKWEYDNTGLLEVWKDGIKVVERNGPVYYNDQSGPYFKAGVYRGNNSECPILLYFDDVRIGNANATYSDVAPR